VTLARGRSQRSPVARSFRTTSTTACYGFRCVRPGRVVGIMRAEQRWRHPTTPHPPAHRKNAAAIPRWVLGSHRRAVGCGRWGAVVADGGYACRWWTPGPRVNHGRPRRATSAPRVPHVGLTGITGLGGLPGRPRPKGRGVATYAVRLLARPNAKPPDRPGATRRGQMRAHHLDRPIVLVDVGGL
jgi:hypothetical protein